MPQILALLNGPITRAMLERGEDVFYYLTVGNENYPQPSLPAGVEADIVRGMYRFATHAPLAVAEGRDVKGLYQRARRGERSDRAARHRS